MINAIILAAGLGKRLLPLTNVVPKPLVPVANKPILFYTLNLLKKYGAKRLAINLFHLPEQIMEWVKLDPICLDFDINFSLEKSIRGTGGGIKQAATLLDRPPFLVINGDILIDLDLDKLMAFHEEKKSLLTMVLREDPMSSSYGIIKIDERNRVRQFLNHSQPEWLQAKRPLRSLMYTGVQLIEEEFLKYIPDVEYSDLSKDVYPRMMVSDLPVYGYIMDNYWNDLGTPERYFQAHKDYMAGRITPIFDPKAAQLGNCPLKEDDIVVVPPAILGQPCRYGRNVTVGPDVSVGNNVTVGDGVIMESSVVWENVYLGNNSKVTNSIILANTKIPPGMKLDKVIAFNDRQHSLELLPLNISHNH